MHIHLRPVDSNSWITGIKIFCYFAAPVYIWSDILVRKHYILKMSCFVLFLRVYVIYITCMLSLAQINSELHCAGDIQLNISANT